MENCKVAILGSGSWATALAKIMLYSEQRINWFIRRQEAIDEFISTGKNPGYLSQSRFDVDRIQFSSDINEVIMHSEILVIAIPSPYVKSVLTKIRRSLKRKIVVSAVKGMIPDENMTITDYIHIRFEVPDQNIAVIAGPCHAEEIALERLSYLTIGSQNPDTATLVSSLFSAPSVHTVTSDDVLGLEYSSVMKNIYSIASGMCHSLRYGDNFQAVLISNAVQEIQRFVSACNGMPSNIDASGYLGDVLVTCYSKFSRNRQFGQMVGMGYSVKAAQMEMQMIAEGYYGTRCIHDANQAVQVSLPIVDAMYDILYCRMSPTLVIQELTQKLK